MTVAEGEKARGLAAAEVAAQAQAQAEPRGARPGRGADRRRRAWPKPSRARRRASPRRSAMEKKAEAWQKYNEAAVLQILAPILPEIARAIAEPLSRIDRITMVNTGGNGDGGVSQASPARWRRSSPRCRPSSSR